MYKFITRRLIRTEKWSAEKIAEIYQVETKNGRIRYNVQVRDAHRHSPYIDKIFGSLEQADDFLNKSMGREVT
jgi:hypothetical protein